MDDQTLENMVHFYLYKSIIANDEIPKKIYQAWHTKHHPEKMRECVNRLKEQNPEFEHYLFDDMDCRDFIVTHFDTSVVNAFDKLIPRSYKSDLWRYCVLYIHGGIYLDIKYECQNNFKFIDLIHREHFVLERPIEWAPNRYGVYNALIISKPNNPIFKNCIDRIVENVKNNYYGFNSLYPTGPGLLGDMVFNTIPSILFFDLMYDYYADTNSDRIIYDHRVILQNYPEYRYEQSCDPSFLLYDYKHVWQHGKIYRTDQLQKTNLTTEEPTEVIHTTV